MSETLKFSEDAGRALLDLLIMNASEIRVIKEQLSMILSEGDKDKAAKVRQVYLDRYAHHNQKLRTLLFEHYGELDVQSLLNDSEE